MTVTAEINVESPTGRRIVRELERHRMVVKLNYPTATEIDGTTGRSYSYDEFKENVKIEFKQRYGVNFDEV
jgi:hypothetical protein